MTQGSSCAAMASLVCPGTGCVTGSPTVPMTLMSPWTPVSKGGAALLFYLPFKCNIFISIITQLKGQVPFWFMNLPVEGNRLHP